MKRIALFLLFALPVCAQVSNPSIVLVSAAPSGSCTANLPDEQVVTLGTLYSCQSGTWTQISGGGGGGSTAFSALTGGTNTTAAMLVGSGATLGTTGTGAIAATTVASASSSTSASFFLCFMASNTTTFQACSTSAGLTFNPATGALTSTSFGTTSSTVFIGANRVTGSSTTIFGFTNGASGGGTIDTTACRNAAGIVEIGSGTTCNSLGGIKPANVVPGILYSVAGTPLPTCSSTISGEQATVSDATSPTYMGAYTGSSTVVAAVICSTTDGTTFSWKTH